MSHDEQPPVVIGEHDTCAQLRAVTTRMHRHNRDPAALLGGSQSHTIIDRQRICAIMPNAVVCQNRIAVEM